MKIEADRILAASKISGEAREKLRALLDEIVAGIGAVAKPEAGVSPLDGLVRADEALARYAKEFDHPGWAPSVAREPICVPGLAQGPLRRLSSELDPGNKCG